MRISLYQNNLLTIISRCLVLPILIFTVLLLPGQAYASLNQQQDVIELVIVGEVLDSQGVPVVDAEIKAVTSQQEESIAEAQSQEDGTWVLSFPEILLRDMLREIAHPHFSTQLIDLQESELRTLNQDDIYQLEPVVLDRRISAGFWIATFVFIGAVSYTHLTLPTITE